VNWTYPQVGEARYLGSSKTPRRIFLRRITSRTFLWRFADDEGGNWRRAKSPVWVEIDAAAQLGMTARELDWHWTLGPVQEERT
jgi:hypothetical protein